MGNDVSFLTNRLGGLARCERHQTLRMLRFQGLEAFEETTHVVATFRGDFVAHPPDFFKNLVLHNMDFNIRRCAGRMPGARGTAPLLAPDWIFADEPCARR